MSSPKRKKPVRKGVLEEFATSFEKQYGPGSVKVGRWKNVLNVIPTGALSLDYELGTGGWPRGHLVGVYGRRDIGKSTVIGLSAVREAQKVGLNVVWIALEPNFDVNWAEKHGVNMDQLIVLWPESGREAFEMLHTVVSKAPEMDIGLVVFDSLGAVQSDAEIDPDSGKPQVGGASRIISWGTNRIAPIAYRNNVCVIFLNQIRDDMNSRIPGLVRQPGGKAIEHLETIIIQLKPGSGKFKIGEVTIGQSLIAHVQRNKMTEGTGQKALFDFYAKDTDGKYPFGIDVVEDVIATGMRTGTMRKRGSLYDLADGTTHKGRDKIKAHLDANPQAYEACRDAILDVMVGNVEKVLVEPETEEGDDDEPVAEEAS